jgi:hypothetical protein
MYEIIPVRKNMVGEGKYEGFPIVSKSEILIVFENAIPG